MMPCHMMLFATRRCHTPRHYHSRITLRYAYDAGAAAAYWLIRWLPLSRQMLLIFAIYATPCRHAEAFDYEKPLVIIAAYAAIAIAYADGAEFAAEAAAATPALRFTAFQFFAATPPPPAFAISPLRYDTFRHYAFIRLPQIF